MTGIVLLLATLGPPEATRTIPDTPVPKVAGILRPGASLHHPDPFWTRGEKAEVVTLAGVAVFDIAQTCRNFGQRGWREVYLPTQSCRGATAILLAVDGGTLGASYLLHRLHHNKLSKVPMLYQIEGHIQGIVYSNTH